MTKGLTKMLTRILTTRLLVVVPIIAMLSVSGCGMSWYVNHTIPGFSGLDKAATPEISLDSGTYNADQHVTISCATPGAVIYYTTDDTDPTTSAHVYLDAVEVKGQGNVVSLKAIAVKEGMDPSDVSETRQYTIDYDILPQVLFSLEEGTFSSDITVTMSVAADGADIYYTLDGTTPTKDSTKYAGASIPVAGHGTSVILKAIAIQDQKQDSIVSTGVYTINYDQISNVTFDPSGGTYSLDQDVAMGTPTTGATVHYTTDGSTPTELSPEYSSAVLVAGHGTVVTIKAIATKTGMLDSAVTSATYTINYSQVSTPQFSIPGAVYATDQSVSISDATVGSVIHYTTNGTTPTSGSPVYVGAISVAGHGTTITIKAIATKSFMLDSPVVSATYTITYDQAATPTFSIPAGTYNTDQTVALSTTTVGAVIHYTTNGSTPTSSSSTYTSPISVAGHGTSMVIKAIAIKSQMLDSAIASGTYTICYDQVATPTFNPVAGTYTSDQSVTISTTTAGATIYYTTDGTTPTTSSTLYSSPVSVAGEGTGIMLRAIAVKTQMLDSAVASGIFTISGSGLIGRWMLNGTYGVTDLSTGGHNGTAAGGITIGGVADQYGQASGGSNFDGSNDYINVGNSSSFNLTSAGAISLWVNVDAYANSYWGIMDKGNHIGDTAGYSMFYYKNWGGVGVGTIIGIITNSSGTWNYATLGVPSTGTWHHLVFTWNGSKLSGYVDGTLVNQNNQTVNAGTNTSALYIGTDPSHGVYYDGSISDFRIYDRGLSATEVANLYTQSISNQAIAPKVSPGAGRYTSNQTVTITSPTSGASIYYTTDGTTPTTLSTLYSAPISVTEGTNTIKAIAAKAGMLDSNVTTGTYTIDSSVGHWMLNNTNGLTDLSSTGANGTASGGVTIGGTTNHSGQANSATVFDGVDDIINVGSSSSLKPTAAITLSAWAKSAATNPYSYVISKPKSSGSYNDYVLSVSPTRASFGVTTTNGWVSVLYTISNANVWRNVVGTYNGSVIKLYVDGTEVASASLSGTITYDNSTVFPTVRVGGWLGTTSEQFAGSIGETRIYNRALTPAEITSLYNSN